LNPTRLQVINGEPPSQTPGRDRRRSLSETGYIIGATNIDEQQRTVDALA
jgi:hypothetical protein